MRRGFSLIELMIVVVILGALTAIIVPMFLYSESDAKADAVISEMRAIQSAYIDFYNDNFPHHAELEELSRYGLYPLCFSSAPSAYTGTWNDAIRSEYDPYNKIGWRGPYLMHEGLLDVRVDQSGQEKDSSGTRETVPVVNDPYGGYYRVLASDADSRKLFLICTGRNQELDTGSTDTNEYGWIEAQADDIALPLLPFN